jgi:hypothetical protein
MKEYIIASILPFESASATGSGRLLRGLFFDLALAEISTAAWLDAPVSTAGWICGLGLL